MFIEEWNAFITAKASGNVTLQFKLMGKNYTLFLQDLLTTNLDMYMSVGGDFNTLHEVNFSANNNNT